MAGAGGEVAAVFVSVVPSAAGMAEKFKSAGAEGAAAFSEGYKGANFDVFGEGLAKGIDDFKRGAQELKNAFGPAAESIGAALKGAFDIGSSITEFGANAAEKFMEGIETILSDPEAGKIGQWATQAFGMFEEAGVNAFEAVAGKIPIVGDAMNAVVDTMKGAFDEVLGLGEQWLGIITDIGQEWQETGRQLAAHTLNSADIEKYMSVLQEISSSGAIVHFQDIAQNIAIINNRLPELVNGIGGSMERLKEFTVTLAEANEILGNYHINVNQLTAAMESFDVPASEMKEALIEITNVARTSNVDFNTLSGLLDRLGPQFQELGLGYEDALYLLSEMNKEGIKTTQFVYGFGQAISVIDAQVEKGVFQNTAQGFQYNMDVIKKELASSEPTIKAMGEKNLEMLFGRRLEPGMKKAIEDGLWDVVYIAEKFDEKTGQDIPAHIELIKKNAEDLKTPFHDLNEETQTIDDRLESISNQLKAAFAPMALAFANAMVDMGNQVSQWLQTHGGDIATWATGVTQSVLSVTGDVIAGLGDALVILAPVGQLALDVFVKAGTIAANMVGMFAEMMEHVPAALGGGDQWKDVAKSAGDALIDITKLGNIPIGADMKNFGEDMKTFGRDTLPDITTKIVAQGEAAANVLKIQDALKQKIVQPGSPEGTAPEWQEAFQVDKEGRMALTGDVQQSIEALRKQGIDITVDKNNVVTSIKAATPEAKAAWEKMIEDAFTDPKDRPKIEPELDPQDVHLQDYIKVNPPFRYGPDGIHIPVIPDLSDKRPGATMDKPPDSGFGPGGYRSWYPGVPPPGTAPPAPPPGAFSGPWSPGAPVPPGFHIDKGQLVPDGYHLDPTGHLVPDTSAAPQILPGQPPPPPPEKPAPGAFGGRGFFTESEVDEGLRRLLGGAAAATPGPSPGPSPGPVAGAVGGYMAPGVAPGLPGTQESPMPIAGLPTQDKIKDWYEKHFALPNWHVDDDGTMTVPTGFVLSDKPDKKQPSQILDGIGIPTDWQDSEGVVVPVTFSMGTSGANPLASAAPSPGGGVGGSAGVPIIQTVGGTWTSPNPAWAALIKRESGGNPTITNTTDSNWLAGHPSEGLFQIVQGTWESHGGLEFAPTPNQATPQQQAIVAARILQANPGGSDWGAGLPGRESAPELLAGLNPSGFQSGGFIPEADVSVDPQGPRWGPGGGPHSAWPGTPWWPTRPTHRHGQFFELLSGGLPPGFQSGGTVPLTPLGGGLWTSPDPEWAKLISRESSGRPSVTQYGYVDVNTGGNEAEGLFQITPKTWAEHGGAEFGTPHPGMATPEQQAIVAARILLSNPSGSDWGEDLGINRENAQKLRAGLVGVPPSTQIVAQGRWAVPGFHGGGCTCAMCGGGMAMKADGGEIPWLSRSHIGKDSIFAMLEPGEFIVQRKVAQRVLPMLNHLNSGRAKGFQGGGGTGSAQYAASGAGDDLQGVDPIIAAIDQIAHGYNLILTAGKSGHGTHDVDHGYHDTGQAGDFSNGVGTPEEAAFATFMAQTYGSQILELIHYGPGWDANFNIKNGKFIKDYGGVPNVYDMGTLEGHKDHVHVAMQHEAYYEQQGMSGPGTGNIQLAGFNPAGGGGGGNVVLASANYPMPPGPGGGFSNQPGYTPHAPEPGIGPGPQAGVPGGPQYSPYGPLPPWAMSQDQYDTWRRSWDQRTLDDIIHNSQSGQLQQEIIDLQKKIAEESGDQYKQLLQNRADAIATGAQDTPAGRKAIADANAAEATLKADQNRLISLQNSARTDQLRVAEPQPYPEPPGAKAAEKVHPDPFAEKLGAGLVKGIFQELGLPDVFGKPFTEWGIWKTAMAGAGDVMGLLQNMGKYPTGMFGQGGKFAGHAWGTANEQAAALSGGGGLGALDLIAGGAQGISTGLGGPNITDIITGKAQGGQPPGPLGPGGAPAAPAGLAAAPAQGPADVPGVVHSAGYTTINNYDQRGSIGNVVPGAEKTVQAVALKSAAPITSGQLSTVRA